MREKQNRVMKELRNCIGFELGTGQWRFYQNGKQIINIPALIELKGGTHDKLIVNGKIGDFDGTELLIRKIINKIQKPFLGFLRLPFKALVSIPSDINDVAIRAYVDALLHVGAKACFMLNDCFIAAAGLGIDIKNDTAMIVDCGKGKTSITTIQGLNIVNNDILDIAGLTLDEAIKTHLGLKYNLIVDLKTAEKIKIDYVDFRENSSNERVVKIGGHDKRTNEMKNISLQISELIECTKNDIEILIERIIRHFENLDDVYMNRIKISGVYLIGNGFKLKGLIDLIAVHLPISSKSYSLSSDYMRIGFEKVQSNPETLYPKMIKINTTNPQYTQSSLRGD